ncbi:hypothetical protein [Myxacorys almedinensis]|uniref:Uncharacterized protein n=1 Tax=Myxacorys almedinensis A TaxID=2690445 RepID=A0A8J7YW36_9CYAN|nr:hypothetical protein [Myxacorys almedinensis]NDJ15747.1 hypothetical protein [Myxacorys almedinensis A]
MYDNKVRLSKDVIDKAELIAAEWGLKNARAAIEAVFRKYADDYLYGRMNGTGIPGSAQPQRAIDSLRLASRDRDSQSVSCEALDQLDDLLGM